MPIPWMAYSMRKLLLGHLAAVLAHTFTLLVFREPKRILYRVLLDLRTASVITSLMAGSMELTVHFSLIVRVRQDNRLRV